MILTNDAEEKELLNRIYDEVKEIDFSENLDVYSRERLNDLLAEGIAEFEWSDVYVNITFSSFEFYQGDSASYNVLTMAPIDEGDAGGGSSKKSCHCTWGWGCIPRSFDCREGSLICKKTEYGCGWFLLDPCTGRCSNRL